MLAPPILGEWWNRAPSLLHIKGFPLITTPSHIPEETSYRNLGKCMMLEWTTLEAKHQRQKRGK